MQQPRHFLKSERFWTIVAVLLVVWIIGAIALSAIIAAQHNPEGFLMLLSPVGLAGIVDLLTPSVLPAILLVGALTMRNIARRQ